MTTLRIGLGHDTHRLVSGDSLTIGGVSVPAPYRFDAHSDGDILIHAIIDALLGATASGDIGEWFSDQDPNHRNRDSTEMLQEVHTLLQKNGWQIVNLDCILFLQSPKLAPYKSAIQRRLAELLGVEPDQIGIKAKTGEHVGTIGRSQAAAAQCAALLEQNTLHPV